MISPDGQGVRRVQRGLQGRHLPVVPNFLDVQFDHSLQVYPSNRDNLSSNPETILSFLTGVPSVPGLPGVPGNPCAPYGVAIIEKEFCVILLTYGVSFWTNSTIISILTSRSFYARSSRSSWASSVSRSSLKFKNNGEVDQKIWYDAHWSSVVSWCTNWSS